MFKYVKKASYILARNLQEIRNESHQHKYCYYYGFQVIIGAINKILILVLLGILLKCLIETIVVTLSFGILRVFAGGFHFKKYDTCVVFSIVTLIFMGYISKHIVTNININVMVISVSMILYLICAPVQNSSRLINKKEKMKFKTISIINLFLLSIPLCVYNITPILLGIIISAIIILPILNKEDSQNVQM